MRSSTRFLLIIISIIQAVQHKAHRRGHQHHHLHGLAGCSAGTGADFSYLGEGVEKLAHLLEPALRSRAVQRKCFEINDALTTLCVTLALTNTTPKFFVVVFFLFCPPESLTVPQWMLVSWLRLFHCLFVLLAFLVILIVLQQFVHDRLFSAF